MDLRPVLLKFGAVLAVSLGGFLYVIVKNKRTNRPSQSPPAPRVSDCGDQVDSSCTSTMSPQKHKSCLPKVPTDNATADLSRIGKYDGDRDGLLLPEFDDLVKNFDLALIKAGIISPREDAEMLFSDVESTGGFKFVASQDQEINYLRHLVEQLKEREQVLEVQLLEYYGLKEQETAVKELQNRLKLNSMEAKVFNHKIESLQAENKRLEAQVADHAKVVAELEAARAKVKLLKKKLRHEAEQNREQILNLQQKVAKLQDQEHKSGAIDVDIQLKLRKLKVLEEEKEELRKSNCVLHRENSDLGQRLEVVEMLATYAIDDGEKALLEEERCCLKQKNEDLIKEIEELRAAQCTDLEELVYLRWINACLRYELKSYQPSPGRTIARDLSKTLSPKSEEKAKQLILEYANKEVFEEKGFSITDFDYDQWSSSQGSSVTECRELDESSVDHSSDKRSHSSSKLKVLSKLRRLLTGHSHRHNRHGHRHITSASVDETRYPSDSTVCNSGFLTGLTPSNGLSSRSLDSQSSFNILRTKAEASNDMVGFRRSSHERSSTFGSISEDIAYLSQEDQIHQDSELGQKSELVKYAVALKDSCSVTSNRRKKAATFHSF